LEDGDLVYDDEKYEVLFENGKLYQNIGRPFLNPAMFAFKELLQNRPPIFALMNQFEQNGQETVTKRAAYVEYERRLDPMGYSLKVRRYPSQQYEIEYQKSSGKRVLITDIRCQNTRPEEFKLPETPDFWYLVSHFE